MQDAVAAVGLVRAAVAAHLFVLCACCWCIHSINGSSARETDQRRQQPRSQAVSERSLLQSSIYSTCQMMYTCKIPCKTTCKILFQFNQVDTLQFIVQFCDLKLRLLTECVGECCAVASRTVPGGFLVQLHELLQPESNCRSRLLAQQ